MSSRHFGPAILAAGLIFCCASAARAQVTGSIAGIVRDSSGAVLPGATVTVRGPALRRESVSVVTTPEGVYRVLLVPPGVYDVTVELDGFSPQTRHNVEVVINKNTTPDLSM